jgi:hypothetical protein
LKAFSITFPSVSSCFALFEPVGVHSSCPSSLHPLPYNAPCPWLILQVFLAKLNQSYQKKGNTPQSSACTSDKFVLNLKEILLSLFFNGKKLYNPEGRHNLEKLEYNESGF